MGRQPIMAGLAPQGLPARAGDGSAGLQAKREPGPSATLPPRHPTSGFAAIRRRRRMADPDAMLLVAPAAEASSMSPRQVATEPPAAPPRRDARQHGEDCSRLLHGAPALRRSRQQDRDPVFAEADQKLPGATWQTTIPRARHMATTLARSSKIRSGVRPSSSHSALSTVSGR